MLFLNFGDNLAGQLVDNGGIGFAPVGFHDGAEKVESGKIEGESHGRVKSWR